MKLYSNALDKIKNGNFLDGMDEIASLFNKETFSSEVFDLLVDTFISLNSPQLKENFIKNSDLLSSYPYIFNKSFKNIDDNTLKLFPINENVFFIFDTTICSFRKIIVNSNTETNYFFNNLDDVICVENEFNEFNISFLVDNVRASEDVGFDNHIYLKYENMEVFSLLMQYFSFENLLVNNKLVFLIGDTHSCPINFKDMFDIDYSKMEYVPVRPTEIKRATFQFLFTGPIEHEFFHKILNSHDYLLSAGFAFDRFILPFFCENENLQVCDFLPYVKNLVKTSDVRLLELFKKDDFSKDKDYASNISDFLNKLLKLHNEYPPENFIELLKLVYLAYNTDKKLRIVPMIFHPIHTINPKLNPCEFNKFIETIDKFEYCYKISAIRDPIASLCSTIDLNIENELFNIYGALSTFYFDFDNIHSNHKTSKFSIPRKLVRFEDAKLNPKATFNAVYEYLNLPYIELLNEDFAISSLYTNALDSISEEEIASFEQILYPYYQHFGYTPLSTSFEIPDSEDIFSVFAEKTSFEQLFENNLLDKFSKKYENTSYYEFLEKTRNKFVEHLKQSYDYMQNIIDDEDFEIYQTITPKNDLLANDIYRNLKSLPWTADTNINFLNKNITLEQQSKKIYWVCGFSTETHNSIADKIFSSLKSVDDSVLCLGNELCKLVGNDDDILIKSNNFVGVCNMLHIQNFNIVCCVDASIFDINVLLEEYNEDSFYIFVNPDDTDFEDEYSVEPSENCLIINENQSDIDDIISSII